MHVHCRYPSEMHGNTRNPFQRCEFDRWYPTHWLNSIRHAMLRSMRAFATWKHMQESEVAADSTELRQACCTRNSFAHQCCYDQSRTVRLCTYLIAESLVSAEYDIGRLKIKHAAQAAVFWQQSQDQARFMCKFNKLWNRRQWKYLPLSLLCLWPSQEHKLILTQYLGICFLLRPTLFKWNWSPVVHKEAYIRSTVWVNVWIPGCDYCQTILRAGLNMLFNVWPHTIILPSSLERSKWKKKTNETSSVFCWGGSFYARR